MENLASCNVLFITLDCCRYDTFEKAQLPYIKSLGNAKKAYTHGDYTLPAHISFFMGYLPRVIDLPYEEFYTDDVRQLWRMSRGRPKSPEQYGILIEGDSIISGYKNRGYTTVGAGGVRWFSHRLLTEMFDDFYYYAESDKDSVFNLRHSREFALNHLNELVSKVGPGPFFLFINSHETHAPYDFGSGHSWDDSSNLINKGKNLWGCKFSQTNKGFDSRALADLHKAQITALETVDEKVQALIDRLPKPLLFVLCGDHGECFGEDGLWGHGFPHEKVMEVPLLIKCIN